MKYGHKVRTPVWSFAFAWMLLYGSLGVATAQHSAGVAVIHDPFPPFYSGTSHPVGQDQVSALGGVPGYFNVMSGGGVGGATGSLTVTPPFFAQTQIQLAGIAIHVTDAAGASHPLSSLNDPALADIVADLNVPFAINREGSTGTAYAFGAAPPQYAGALALLSAGEATNGGQPFDILLELPYTIDSGFQHNWILYFDNEVGHLDGITALSVTDVGAINIPAVPEPSVGVTFCVVILLTLGRRRARAALGT